MQRKRIAIVVAHPDDEILGFGGVMALHSDKGDSVNVLILATGLSSRNLDRTVDRERLVELRESARAAADILGVEILNFADFPDNQMDSVPMLDVVQTIESFLVVTSSTTLYTHHTGDLNIDHQIVGRASLTACRPLPNTVVKEVLAGEVNSSTEWSHVADTFAPTEFCDISTSLDRKLEALECYESELHDWPHPRSRRGVETLARWRGNQAGLDAAEAFCLLRRIRSI